LTISGSELTDQPTTNTSKHQSGSNRRSKELFIVEQKGCGEHTPSYAATITTLLRFRHFGDSSKIRKVTTGAQQDSGHSTELWQPYLESLCLWLFRVVALISCASHDDNAVNIFRRISYTSSQGPPLHQYRDHTRWSIPLPRSPRPS
jgi:hypothetical protein